MTDRQTNKIHTYADTHTATPTTHIPEQVLDVVAELAEVRVARQSVDAGRGEVEQSGHA